ncbi:MAG: XrtB/PEP-CTERM-associated transcriptional regulator EpsA [Nitrosospira sp.]
MAISSPCSFPSSLSDEHLERYFRVIREGIAVQSHSDLLRWLQGEIQHYLPHEIMLAVWNDAGANSLRHDLVSVLPGVRTEHLHTENLLALQRGLYSCWVELGKAPYRLSLGACDFRFGDRKPLCAFREALHDMRSLLVHGIVDERGGQDCLYVIFSSTGNLNDSLLSAMENLLPYLDAALRRLQPLARQNSAVPSPADTSQNRENFGLSAREVEILDWVRAGKTNAEIASILAISIYTVKNHLRHIFKKLDVYNRVQAISKASPAHLAETSSADAIGLVL